MNIHYNYLLLLYLIHYYDDDDVFHNLWNGDDVGDDVLVNNVYVYGYYDRVGYDVSDHVVCVARNLILDRPGCSLVGCLNKLLV